MYVIAAEAIQLTSGVVLSSRHACTERSVRRLHAVRLGLSQRNNQGSLNSVDCMSAIAIQCRVIGTTCTVRVWRVRTSSSWPSASVRRFSAIRLFTLVHVGKYRTEDKLKIIQYRN